MLNLVYEIIRENGNREGFVTIKLLEKRIWKLFGREEFKITMRLGNKSQTWIAKVDKDERRRVTRAEKERPVQSQRRSKADQKRTSLVKQKARNLREARLEKDYIGHPNSLPAVFEGLYSL